MPAATDIASATNFGRLIELGQLRRLDRVSGVSGGSIFAGVLALNWATVSASDTQAALIAYRDRVIDPLRDFAQQHIDLVEWIVGTLLPGTSPVKRLVRVLDRHLYHGATLQDLPEAPRFVINATNLGTGVLWRFSRPYMADYRLGCIPDPTVSVATAVAASSAFPPFFSPLRLSLKESMYSEAGSCAAHSLSEMPAKLTDLRRNPQLADGGVYDNLGLETVWKSYRDVLVSDGGGAFADQVRVRGGLVLQSIRVMKTIDRQVRAMRRNILVSSYQRPETDELGWRRGAYWGIRTPITDYKAPGQLPCPPDRTIVLANEPTRLWRMADLTQERLINWGYASADAALRSYYEPTKSAPPPEGFPFPNAAV